MTSVAMLVDQLYASAPGGIGTYIRELVPALAEASPATEITLFHHRFDGAGAPERWMKGFWTEELPRSIGRAYPAWNTAGRPLLPKALGALDVLHAPSSVAVPPPGPGQRLVVTVHDLAFRHFPSLFPAAWRTMYRLGLRRTVARADAVITPSRFTAEDLARSTRIDPSRIHVVPLAAALPADLVPLEPVLERLKVRQPYILFVGTLEPRKNLVRLVRAYRRAARGLPHTLVLAGPLGWNHQALLRELHAGGPGEILLTGKGNAGDLDALYRGAAAFAYPSLYEGFGLPVVEAMKRGVPTMVSSASSLPEVAGDAAVIVDPLSIRDIARGLAEVADEANAHRLRAAALARAERFSWAETARLTLHVYEKAS